MKEKINLSNRKNEAVNNTPRLGKTIELDIEWPEASIGALHFNFQKTHAVFELGDDGNYYSRDILFMSARDNMESKKTTTCTDSLSRYLRDKEVKKAVLSALEKVGIKTSKIKVFIPSVNSIAKVPSEKSWWDIKHLRHKKYNGVTWKYWLSPHDPSSTINFPAISSIGKKELYHAGAVCGVAPAFSIGK
jgi:hypothetical protein